MCNIHNTVGPESMEALNQQYYLRFRRGTDRSDIYDGDVYQALVRSGFLRNKNNISLILNTDGIPVFRSSSFAFWPLHLMINEFPFKMRQVWSVLFVLY